MTNKIYSFDGETFQYDTLTELIKDINSCDEGDVTVGSIVYVAEKHRPKVASLVDVEALLEQMSEWSYDTHGCDEADMWPDLSTSESKELSRMIAEYIEKVSPPSFWIVRDVKEYIVTAEDLG